MNIWIHVLLYLSPNIVTVQLLHHYVDHLLIGDMLRQGLPDNNSDNDNDVYFTVATSDSRVGNVNKKQLESN